MLHANVISCTLLFYIILLLSIDCHNWSHHTSRGERFMSILDNICGCPVFLEFIVHLGLELQIPVTLFGLIQGWDTTSYRDHTVKDSWFWCWRPETSSIYCKRFWNNIIFNTCQTDWGSAILEDRCRSIIQCKNDLTVQYPLMITYLYRTYWWIPADPGAFVISMWCESCLYAFEVQVCL